VTGPASHPAAFTRGLRVQSRVVGALIMREIITRYGRHNIGFMWLFVEPMMFTLGVVSIYLLFNHHLPGVSLIPFTVIGYSSVLLWRNTIGRCGNAIEPNRSLLHHRHVRVIDLFIARLILEAAGSSIAFLILATLLVAGGLMPPPDDPFKMIVGWSLLAWFAMCVGMLTGCLAVVSDSVERLWHVLAYLFLPVSGAFFMVDWLPKALQKWALLVPSVNCAELLRDGYFGAHAHAHYDVAYVAVVNILLMLAGLLAVMRVATTVEGE
jgi:capsular polysaccharide transport system permease protein